MSISNLIIPEDLGLQRIDAYLAQSGGRNVSRSQIKKLIDAGRVHVNGHEVSAHYAIKAGDHVPISWDDEPVEDHQPENIPLEILYEDEHLLFVNKPDILSLKF